MNVKIIHLDEPRCGGRMSKNDVDFWYHKKRYQEMENKINDFMGDISQQGYNVVDLKINWQSNTATILYEAGMGFDPSKYFDDKNRVSPSIGHDENDWTN